MGWAVQNKGSNEFAESSTHRRVLQKKQIARPMHNPRQAFARENGTSRRKSGLPRLYANPRNAAEGAFSITDRESKGGLAPCPLLVTDTLLGWCKRREASIKLGRPRTRHPPSEGVVGDGDAKKLLKFIIDFLQFVTDRTEIMFY